MPAIAEEAHKLGRKVAAHAHGTQSIKDAIRAGIDSIEHASLIDDEGIALAKQHGTFLVFDIYNDDYILSEGAKVGMLPESIEKERRSGNCSGRISVRRIWPARAWRSEPTAAFIRTAITAKQFAMMVEWGMKPIEAIRAATTEAAALLGLEGKAGAIEPQHLADVIAVDGNPLEDARLLTRVKFVMKEGKVYRNDWAEDQSSSRLTGRPAAGKSTIARSLARQARVHLHRHRGDVPRGRAVGAAGGDRSRRLHRLEQLAREARIEFDGDSTCC